MMLNVIYIQKHPVNHQMDVIWERCHHRFLSTLDIT